jgi:SAM-dependent methyltransferase
MNINQITSATKNHYNQKIVQYGACHKGVDWGSEEGQRLRFDIICKNLELESLKSIIDYGCGYGEFYSFIKNLGFNGFYQGYDISEEMIQMAKKLHGNDMPNKVFTHEFSVIERAEYCMASGVFNIKLYSEEADWHNFIVHNLSIINKISIKGFFFNMFSKEAQDYPVYSDVYYADAVKIKELCLKEFSKRVKLFEGYYRNDFTVLVEK